MGIEGDWYQLCSRLSNFFLMLGRSKFVADIRVPAIKMIAMVLSKKKLYFFCFTGFVPISIKP